MINMPKISVVIPLYNKEKYIARAINSVLAQTVQDFEIIVADDGSTDGGVEVVKAIGDIRIRLIQQVNQGVSAARNRGIDEAKADLIAFLDADDAWKPQFLEIILRLRSNYPDAGAYATAYEIKEPNGKIVKPKSNTIPLCPWEGIIPNYFESVLSDSSVSSSAVAIPKKVFNVVGSFPEGEKMGEDLDMWLRVALKYPIAFSNTIGAMYHRDSMNRVCPTEYSISDYKFVKTAREAILNNTISDKDKLYLTEYIYMKEIERAGRCIVRGENRKARQLLKESNTRYFKKKRIIFLLSTFFPTSTVRLFRFLKKKILRRD